MEASNRRSAALAALVFVAVLATALAVIASRWAGWPAGRGDDGALSNEAGAQAEPGLPEVDAGVVTATPATPVSEVHDLSEKMEAGIPVSTVPAPGSERGTRVTPSTPTPAVAPMIGQEPGRPLWLTIAAAEVSAPIEAVGLTQDEIMATPTDWADVGWFRLGYIPGQPGTAVINGHLDAPGRRPAVFWRLGLLKPGDQIKVEMDNGLTHLYSVEESLSYPYDEAPMEEIFAWSPEPRLALITCQGKWNRSERSYEERLVVFARYVRQIDAPANEKDDAIGVAGSP